MRIEPRHLIDELQGKGGSAFEHFLFDLLALEARAAGIPLKDIVWDHRTNIGDGGRDIVVHKAADSSHPFFPERPTIWSAKSGGTAREPSTLNHEISSHDAVKDLLNSGYHFQYTLLASCSQDQKDALRAECETIETSLGLDAGTIHVVHVEHLANRVNQCPTLVPRHLSNLSFHLGTGATHFVNWTRLQFPTSSAAWIDLDGRTELLDTVQRIFDSDVTPGFIHVAGWSGVGKTRLVTEAVQRSSADTQITFYPTWDAYNDGLRNSLQSGQIQSALLVIDEVEIGDVAELRRVCNANPGVRIVSIGSISEREVQSGRADVLIMERPNTSQLEQIVIARLPPHTDKSFVERICDLSDNDIRMSEMLCSAYSDPVLLDGRESELLAQMTVPDFLGHYLRRHKSSIGDGVLFCEQLSALTLLSEVGNAGELRAELQAISALLAVSESDLDRVNARAASIGLCRSVGRMTECIPRPCAAYLFDHYGWPQIEHRLFEFFKSLPSGRARRAFLRRVAYCGKERREHVEQALDSLFWAEYASHSLATLSDPNVARTLRMFGETIPSTALRWLRGLIATASLGDLEQFKGSVGAFGPSFGRREVVWLCEGLRCFGEYFEDTEFILFHLALAENEELGNNATAEWQQCFWWILSGTEVPFEERIRILLRRLEVADAQSLPLLLKGVRAVLHHPSGGIAPPQVVGGRLTPSQWQPDKWGDVFSQWARVIDAVVQFWTSHESLRSTVTDHVTHNIELYLQRGIPDSLRASVLLRENLSGEQMRHLRAGLRRMTRPTFDIPDDLKRQVDEWLTEFAPDTLDERLMETLSRGIWELQRRNGDHVSSSDPFVNLALEVKNDPDVLKRLQDWLGSPNARSVSGLGYALAKDADCVSHVQPIIVEWMQRGVNHTLVVYFLIEVARQEKVLPQWARQVLDNMVESNPDACVLLSIDVDISTEGLERVFQALPTAQRMPSELLSRLFGRPWEGVLTENHKLRVLQVLEDSTTDPSAIPVALNLVTMWQFENRSVGGELATAIGSIVQQGATTESTFREHDWEECAKLWSEHEPKKAALCFIDLMTDVDSRRFNVAHTAERVFIGMAAQFPDEVTSAVSRALGDKKKRLVFHFSVFRGLLQPLGLERVKALVAQHGEEGAAALARHAPDVDRAGSEISRWLLREYGHLDRVFREFCFGRHSGVARWGHAFDHQEQIYKRTEPYLNDPIPAIQNWARWERAEIDFQAKEDRREVDEMGRD